MKKMKPSTLPNEPNMNPMEKIMQQQEQNFFIVRNEFDGDTYHWIDRDISLYSSRKLWELVRTVESTTTTDDQNIIELIKGELIFRGQTVNQNPWRHPH
ncbi:MAG: hypothetical protein ACI89U_001641 [Gammaproteobacteria bacterium]|jgi:hypothetical protein